MMVAKAGLMKMMRWMVGMMMMIIRMVGMKMMMMVVMMTLLRMHGEGSCGRHLGKAKVHLRCVLVIMMMMMLFG